MDPKFLAKAKARAAGAKGPPPLPAVDQERPTPRPPALDPDRPTSRPAAPHEPKPTPGGPVAEAVPAAPVTPRPLPVDAPSADDEDEHTVMRPATAPLPRDAFREDGSATFRAYEGEPSVGLPLELPVQQTSTRKSRAGIAWVLLGATALGAAAAVVVKQRQSAELASAAAPAPAPKSFTRPPPTPAPPRPRDDGSLDPPISTSADANEELPEEELTEAPTSVRRRPRPVARPAQVAQPPAAAPAAAGEPGAAPAAEQAAADGKAPAVPEPSAAGAGGAAALAAPSPEAASDTTSSGTIPTPPTAGAEPEQPAAADDGKPSNGSADEPLQGNVDPENPYGE